MNLAPTNKPFCILSIVKGDVNVHSIVDANSQYNLSSVCAAFSVGYGFG